MSDDMIAGAFAGLIARLISAPFDIIKIRSQLHFNKSINRPGIIASFKKVVKEEGFLSLWKGNMSATWLWISYSLVQFTVYGMIKRLLETVPDPLWLSKDTQELHPPSSKEFNPTNRREAKKTSSFWRTLTLFIAGAVSGMI